MPHKSKNLRERNRFRRLCNAYADLRLAVYGPCNPRIKISKFTILKDATHRIRSLRTELAAGNDDILSTTNILDLIPNIEDELRCGSLDTPHFMFYLNAGITLEALRTLNNDHIWFVILLLHLVDNNSSNEMLDMLQKANGNAFHYDEMQFHLQCFTCFHLAKTMAINFVHQRACLEKYTLFAHMRNGTSVHCLNIDKVELWNLCATIVHVAINRRISFAFSNSLFTVWPSQTILWTGSPTYLRDERNQIHGTNSVTTLYCSSIMDNL